MRINNLEDRSWNYPDSSPKRKGNSEYKTSREREG